MLPFCLLTALYPNVAFLSADSTVSQCCLYLLTALSLNVASLSADSTVSVLSFYLLAALSPNVAFLSADSTVSQAYRSSLFPVSTVSQSSQFISCLPILLLCMPVRTFSKTYFSVSFHDSTVLQPCQSVFCQHCLPVLPFYLMSALFPSFAFLSHVSTVSQSCLSIC